jgi:hypothetical protein
VDAAVNLDNALEIGSFIEDIKIFCSLVAAVIIFLSEHNRLLFLD